jgi:hypothetical protein
MIASKPVSRTVSGKNNALRKPQDARNITAATRNI